MQTTIVAIAFGAWGVGYRQDGVAQVAWVRKAATRVLCETVCTPG